MFSSRFSFFFSVSDTSHSSPLSNPPLPPPHTHPPLFLKVPTEVKFDLIHALAAAGLPAVEATSFVSPKWVPQLSDAAAVLARVGSSASLREIAARNGTRFPVLTPNMRGLERALEAGATEVAIFAAATESFSRRNLNASVDEALGRFADVAAAAADAGVPVRGSVSVAAGCPYEGKVDPRRAGLVARRLADMGCYEVSLGDTVGVATPGEISALFRAVKEEFVPVSRLASHCHDTYGQGVANVVAAMGEGVATHDSSVAGLGGCPFAPGAAGNVATEDVLYLLDGLGIEHGCDLGAVAAAGEAVCRALGRETRSRAGRAVLAARERRRREEEGEGGGGGRAEEGGGGGKAEEGGGKRTTAA